METISIVRGNDFRLRIPISRHVIQVNGTVTEEDFAVEDAEVLKVFLEGCEQHAIELPWTEDVENESSIVCDVDGLIRLGTYHLIIAGKQNGKKFRSKERRQLRIVDNNERANIWPSQYDSFEAYSLDTMVVLDCRGRDGLSAYELAVLNGFTGTETQWLKSLAIKSIEKTGTEDLTDTYTITYSNGETSTFQVENGESTYHMAVRLGLFNGTEEEWASVSNWPTLDEVLAGMLGGKLDDVEVDGVSVVEVVPMGGGYRKVAKFNLDGMREAIDGLQGQIDAMVADKATVSLTASPNTVYNGEQNTITLTAKVTGATASSIIIKKGGNALISDANKSQLATTDTITTSSNISYSAEFVINGVTKTASATVTAVGKIYYGAGADVTDATTIASKRTSPAGTYNVTVAVAASYIFFVVPNNMTINSATMGGFEFPLDAPTTTTRDGATYKVYKSSSTMDEGTHEIVIR